MHQLIVPSMHSMSHRQLASVYYVVKMCVRACLLPVFLCMTHWFLGCLRRFHQRLPGGYLSDPDRTTTPASQHQRSHNQHG